MYRLVMKSSAEHCGLCKESYKRCEEEGQVTMEMRQGWARAEEDETDDDGTKKKTSVFFLPKKKNKTKNVNRFRGSN